MVITIQKYPKLNSFMEITVDITDTEKETQQILASIFSINIKNSLPKRTFWTLDVTMAL